MESPDRDAFYWKLGAVLAMFFGAASVAISFLELLLSDRPFDPTLLAFGLGCLFFCWLTLQVTVRGRVGRDLPSV